jgi:NitT/TauT family transport system substrate-binding protein
MEAPIFRATKKPAPIGSGPPKEETMMMLLRICAVAAGLIFALIVNVRAEVTQLTVAQQYGVSFLPLMMMEKHSLVEKYAAAAGLPAVKVNWAKLAGPSVMNDGLISGSIHFAAQGAPSMILLWGKTRGQIKGVAAMTTYPLYLISRNPQVKTIKDFTPNDKIAVPSIKISTQAIMLQMAAAAAFGDKDYAKLDVLTVSLSHPDAVLAFTNNTAGVNAHYSSSPFLRAGN